MFSVLFEHVWVMCWICLGYLFGISWTCLGHMFDAFGICLGHVLDMLGYVWGMFGVCLGHVRGMFWASLGHYNHQSLHIFIEEISIFCLNLYFSCSHANFLLPGWNPVITQVPATQ